MQIDLNADVGESFGAWVIGRDQQLIPLVSSVNIACGAHAGDPLTIARTIELARACGASIGAHPGYPDLAGFGRRDLGMEPRELEASVLYQVAAVAGMAGAMGCELRHVKPHGALYNRAAEDMETALAVARAVRRFSRELRLVGRAGSLLLDVAGGEGLAVAAEAFADRRYEPDGRLRFRGEADAVLAEPAAAAAQAVAIARDGVATATGGDTVHIRADTICVHGDSPDAPLIAGAVRQALEGAGLEVAAMEPAGKP
ncbi:MAG: LamB/YcsF family protein [Candidatus Limnocylindrales bacterium]